MFWLLLSALAWSAPVELPAGESAAAWARPLALAGLEAGTVGAGEGVRVVATVSKWELVVRDEHGVERRVTVPSPKTPEAREEVAALAASLLHPVSRVAAMPLPDLPPLPAPAPSRPAATVARAAPTQPPTAVVAPPVEPAPLPVAPPGPPSDRPLAIPFEAVVAVRPPLPVAPRDPPVTVRRPGPLPWASVGPTLRLRSRVGATAALGGWIGAALPSPVRFGIGLEASLPATLRQLSDEGGARRMWTADLRGLAAWAPGRWDLGLTGGASRRVFTDPVAAPAPVILPTVGTVLALRLPVSRGLQTRLALAVEWDPVPTDLWTATTLPAGRLPRWSAGLSGSLHAGGGSLRAARGTAGWSATR